MERLGDALAAQGLRRSRSAVQAGVGARLEPLSNPSTQGSLRTGEGGYLTEGIADACVLLARWGETIPQSRTQLAAQLLYRCVRLALRGLDATVKDRAEIDEARAEAADFYFAIASGLSQQDPLLAFELNTRGLLKALNSGDATRIHRGLLLEATFLSSLGRSKRHEVGSAFQRANIHRGPLRNQPRQSHHAPARCCRIQHRQLPKAFDYAEQTERELLGGLGETWELAVGRLYAIRALAYLGRYRELIRRIHRPAPPSS